MITKEEKGEIYEKLYERLKKALISGFWLEATMIEYNIIEDRTAAILYYGNVSKKPWSKKLENKLNSLDMQIGKQHPIISAKVSPEVILEIRSWKKQRNDAVHKACYIAYSEKDFQEIAQKGKQLADQISNESKKVKRAAEKEARK